MKTEVEKLEATKAKLTVTVPFEEIKGEVDKAYKKVGEQVNIPGFRRGHVPAQVLDRKVGRAYILEQAINESLSGLYSKALVEADLQPLGQPDIEVTGVPNLEGKLGGELVFTAEVLVVPEFELPDCSGLKLTVEPAKTDDNAVEAELDALRARFASLKTVERAAEKDDFTSIDLAAKVAGEEVDSMAGVSYQIGAGNMLDGIDEALTGMKAGEEKTFTSTLKGGEHAGKEAEVSVKLNSVKVQELPEADDDFAMMASEHDTIGALRVELRENVEKAALQAQALEARDNLADYLVENTEVPLPEELVAKEVERLSAGGDRDEKEVRAQVEKQMKAELVANRLADKYEVTVEGNELYQSLFELAKIYGIDPMQMIQDQNQVAALAADLRRNKALVHILRDVEVKDTEGKVVDLSEFTKEQLPEENAEESSEEKAEEK